MIQIDFPYKGCSLEQFTTKALTWANSQRYFAYFNSNNISYPHGGFRHVLAVGQKASIAPSTNTAFEDLKKLHDQLREEQWLFGYLGYDLKNQVENLESNNKEMLGFSDTQFFAPDYVLEFKDARVQILVGHESIIDTILSIEQGSKTNVFSVPEPSVSKADYLSNVDHLRQHILTGDCYEINYCQEFHGEITDFNPIELYLSLNSISPNPFSGLLKLNHHYIVSASPERFMKQKGTTIISQPIKGTRQRSSDANEDIRLKTDLRNDPKELAENMMIVDLVRNDLARSSKTGSVKVEEIFGIYSFPQVHQMISTITSETNEGVSSIEVIEKAFPMGSMTGAPKVKVMQLIEQYENTKRGPFSGAAGYFNGQSSFDFNVLIRSIFINEETKTYSFQVGGAITYDSIPEQEYAECMLKAKAIFELIESTQKDTTNR